MDELTGLSAPKISRKRKTDEAAAPAEQKPPKTTKFSFFTESQMAEVVVLFGELLQSPESAVSVVPSDTHYVLHLRKLSGQVTLAALENALAQFNKLYQVRTVTIDLQRQFIDVRFRMGLQGVEMPNVIELGKRELLDVTRNMIRKIDGSSRDPNDWCLLSALMTHVENVLGDRTPADLDVVVETPDGHTLMINGTQENKTPRTNYLVHITGYRELDREHLLSFTHILPFHVHSPTVDFDRKSVQVQMERYNAPRTGEVTTLRMDMGTGLNLSGGDRNGSSIL
jgi:hypothetical protein